MKGHNRKFRASPKSYLEKNAVACYNVGTEALRVAIAAVGGNVHSATHAGRVEFDLVPNKKGGYVDLTILGPVGTYGNTTRKGSPIVGHWVPYLGQKANPDPGQFGHINLATVDSNYVFTVGFSGCQFTAVQMAAGTYLYHEPTAASWGNQRPNYNGNVLVEARPQYDDARMILGGFACAVRTGQNWTIYVQTIKGVKVVALDEFPL